MSAVPDPPTSQSTAPEVDDTKQSPALAASFDPFHTVLAKSPYPAWSMSALCFAAMSAAQAKQTGIPSFIGCTAFGLIFAGSGYITSTGDLYHGAGTSTAWSLTYTLFNLRNAIRSRKPLPLLLVSAAIANASLYGKYYFLDS